ncbi:Heat stress transcription factor B-4 like [Actinidia chinensis var. chinensis]|uniref:Heat stress transcription factor B-4 like n=1 Tax=Actinidia chinensis var. chinensis TaxID=1590841 RepID=A0A2R6R3D8_ACTCC|nr:Heat stress transcription factor B-4 like [Actinidia chinensis var. chinensis]
MALILDNCETILFPSDSHKSVPAPFLTKTYQLVDDPTTNYIVSWGEDEATFVVWRPPEFARDLLPSYFKHNNFSSFVRQLNTYGFRKIVPERWEFANQFFKKGEKHLLCEIHRRKTSQPLQMSINHHHPLPHSQIGGGPGFFPYLTQASVSPPNSDDQAANWCDYSPLHAVTGGFYDGSVATALSEDNDRLRRSNNMLMSEITHMRKLYNDIIYFVQNHVKPVGPSNTLSLNTSQKAMNHLIGYNQTGPEQGVVEEGGESHNILRTKLFGVNLQAKKRLHSEYSSSILETNKARLMLERDDLGLNLMPPSPC